MFSFKRLIKKYGKFPVSIIRHEEGHYNYERGGIWVDGIKSIIIIEGAVVPLSNSDLNYDEGGTYTTQDRKLYTYSDIKLGEKVTHKDKGYTIQEAKSYTDFDEGLGVYFMKRAGD